LCIALAAQLRRHPTRQHDRHADRQRREESQRYERRAEQRECQARDERRQRRVCDEPPVEMLPIVNRRQFVAMKPILRVRQDMKQNRCNRDEDQHPRTARPATLPHHEL